MLLPLVRESDRVKCGALEDGLGLSLQHRFGVASQ
jgi:hypothetical protein